MEIRNFDPITDAINASAEGLGEDEADDTAVCGQCEGTGGWDEEMFDDENGEEYEAWVVCDECDGTGFLD